MFDQLIDIEWPQFDPGLQPALRLSEFRKSEIRARNSRAAS